MDYFLTEENEINIMLWATFNRKTLRMHPFILIITVFFII